MRPRSVWSLSQDRGAASSTDKPLSLKGGGEHRRTVSERQLEAGARPRHRDQPAGARERDIGGAQVATTEADVGGEQIAGRIVLGLRAVGRDRGDAAVDQSRDADPTLAVDSERVEQLKSREAVQ